MAGIVTILIFLRKLFFQLFRSGGALWPKLFIKTSAAIPDGLGQRRRARIYGFPGRNVFPLASWPSPGFQVISQGHS
jgi:hypothetical protein